MKKIVIFAPHPDDELIAAGGSILKWMEKGDEIHIIYLSDGRAAYTFERKNNNLIENEVTKISEGQLAEIRMQEIDEVIEFLEIPQHNISKFQFPDQKVQDFADSGVKQCKEIIADADRVIIPSDNNPHIDHQSTHDIAVRGAQELGLNTIEFYVYAVYLTIKAPKNHKTKISIDKYNQKVYEALQLYKTQKFIKTVNAAFERKKEEKWEIFGVFSLGDRGKYYNF
jgi:LmbE family N-acetylglucosaminyl deacetylase